MELETFGAVFSFAIQLEEASAKFYENAIELIESDDVKSTISALTAGTIKRIKRVVKTRQEFVREAILVHVADLHKNDYLLELKPIHGMKGHQILDIAIKIEQNNQRFYNEAAVKIGQPDVSRAFKRLAKDNSTRKLKLESFI
jgi:rubrerythrin